MDQLKKVKFINSIQVTLALAVGLIVVITISSMGLLLYDSMDKVVKTNSTEATQKIIQQVNYDIEYYLDTVETTIDAIKYSDVVAKYFDDPSEENQDRAINYIDSLLVNREDIINIGLIMPNGKIIVNDKEATIKESVDFTLEPYYYEATTKESMYVSSSHVQNIILGQYQWVVSCSSGFYSGDSNDVKGVILVDLNFNLIEDMVSRISLGERGYIFIIDREGQIVYHPKRDLIYSGIGSEDIEGILKSDDIVYSKVVDNSKVDYILTDSEFSKWKVIGKIFEKDFNIYRQTFRNFFITLVIIALIIAFVASVLLAGRILRPVKRLLKGIFVFQTGQLDVSVKVESDNELGLLTASFNRMTKRIKALVEENKKVERTKRKSELDALQAQINPHFLYNTLDSIVWMGEAGRSDEVVKMTSSLAKLFRISINKGKEYITLKQEIEHVESYLIIQQMRYGEQLEYTIDVDESLLNVRMIKILLQPIIENAIYHGIKKLPGNGLIQVRVSREGDMEKHNYMHIEIQDNGMGMDQETIDKLLSGQISVESKGSGVGVYNVDQRIKLYYGEEYGLDIQSEVFEGTIITLRLPILLGGNHEES